MVVTGEDKPRGRGHRVQPTPVASLAQRWGLPVLKVPNLRTPAVLEQIMAKPCDALVLVAFGHLVPRRLLEYPPRGAINLHPSLLPRHRGAAPIHAPLLAGEDITGVTTMYMDEGLDTGDIILQERVAIAEDANAGDLHDLLAVEGAELLVRTLDLVEAGTAPRLPQDEAKATYAPKVQKEAIDWERPAQEIVRRVRGLSPFPGVFTHWRGERLKPLRAREGSEKRPGAAPGTLVACSDEGLGVAAGDGGTVLLTQVQLPGRAPVSAAEFVRGFRPEPGERFT